MGAEAPKKNISLAFVYLLGGALVPLEGSVGQLFWWGPCALSRKCALAVLVGGLCPKNKCWLAKDSLLHLMRSRVLVVQL